MTSLIQEDASLPASYVETRFYDNEGKLFAAVASEEKEIDLILPWRLSSQEVPQKNTFIHYDICAERPPTPSSSAPGVLLSRLFKTKPQKSEEPTVERLPSTDSSISSISDSLTASNCDFENDSQASTSDSNLASPAELNSASASDLVSEVQANVAEMHRLGQCTPCNYHFHKKDGCRQGSKCEFCHLCPKGEIKKRKKDKVRELRKAAGRRRWSTSLIPSRPDVSYTRDGKLRGV